MIRYVLSRMWLFHGTVPPHVPADARNLAASGDLIALLSGAQCFSDKDAPGFIQLTWRQYSEQERRGHDIYPAIDLLPDAPLLQWIARNRLDLRVEGAADREGNTLFGKGTVRLRQFRMRVTDYGYLNVLLAFEADDVDGLMDLIRETPNLTREITDLVVRLDPLFESAGRRRCLIIDQDRFGIPARLQETTAVDETDTYLYQAHVFLCEQGGPSLAECKRALEVSEPVLRFQHDSDVFQVCCLWQTPVWLCARIPDPEELTTFVEPDNLLLAEKCTYDVALQLYVAASTLVARDANTDIFGERELQRLSIKFAATLGAITIRRTALSEWQNEYIEVFRQNCRVIDDAATAYRDAERLLQTVIQSTNDARRSRDRRRIELFLAVVAILTLCSVYTDLWQFSKEHYRWGLLLLGLLVICGIAVAYHLFRRMKD